MDTDEFIDRILQEGRESLDGLWRAAGIDPASLAPRRTCKHKPTEGPWLSIAHACRCLGIRHDQLYAATMSGQIRYRIVGVKHEHLQLRTADLIRDWPEHMRAFTENSGINSELERVKTPLRTAHNSGTGDENQPGIRAGTGER